MTAPTAVQRQSCDRCHNQKLRCIRSKKSGKGNACDRCLSKQAQCVYSYSLPKGRPSLHRLAEKSNHAGDTGDRAAGLSSRSRPTSVVPAPPVVSSDADAATQMKATDELSVPSELMDLPMDMSTGPWPWLETSSWDDMQFEIDWSSNDSSHVDAVATSPDPFQSDDGACPASTIPNKYDHNSSDYTGRPVIAHLSQLSMRLSSLRDFSDTLAQTAESSSSSSSSPSSGRQSNDGQVSLIHSVAFESVAAWLAHGQCSSGNTNAHHPSVHIPTEFPDPYQSPGLDLNPRGGHNFLRDVFSASHSLLEILRLLQVNNMVDVNAQASNGGHHTISIIRHLVMACNALLLEIYVAILIALQHDTNPGDPMNNNATALGDFRLVMVVQLCSYLIERQHRAIDQFFAPPTPQKFGLFGSLPPRSGHLDPADREALSHLEHQVHQRLAHLRQTLRCT